MGLSIRGNTGPNTTMSDSTKNQTTAVKIPQLRYCLWNHYCKALLSTQNDVSGNKYIIYLYTHPYRLLKMEQKNNPLEEAPLVQHQTIYSQLSY